MKKSLCARVIKKIQKEYLIRKYRREFAKRSEPVKLNVGCGTDYKPGWINIDNNSDCNIQKLDLHWDLRFYLPFPSESVDFIFNEHFLEHLSVEDGKAAISEFLRVLKPGGVLRIAMPNFAETMAAYGDKNWKEAPVFRTFHLEFVQTPAEWMNICFRWWGHQWLYDWQELERRIREVSNSVQITQCSLRESLYSELCNLETRAESTLIAEVRKPE